MIFKDRLFIEQTQSFLHWSGGPRVMRVHDNASELSWPERDDQAAACLHAVSKSLRQQVREGLVEWDR
jgi:hypothetical protein